MLPDTNSVVRLRHGPYTRRMALFAGIPLALQANPANGDRRLEGLFSRFIAPCCWRENLLVHQSPKADELRAKIRKDVAAGRSDAEIQRNLTAEYSTRILALPEGAKGEWLRWTPLAALAAGLATVGVFLQKSLARRAQATSSAAAPVAALPPDWEDFDL